NCRRESSFGPSDAVSGAHSELPEARHRIAIWGYERAINQLDDAPLDTLAHDVFPPAGLLVHERQLEANDISEEPLGEAVLAHHPYGDELALFGQLKPAVYGVDLDEAVALHTSHGLRDRGTRVVEVLRNAGSHGHYSVLAQFIDGAQVHLCGVDEVRHDAKRPIPRYVQPASIHAWGGRQLRPSM